VDYKFTLHKYSINNTIFVGTRILCNSKEGFESSGHKFVQIQLKVSNLQTIIPWLKYIRLNVNLTKRERPCGHYTDKITQDPTVTGSKTSKLLCYQ
jgi:hypothetical protein